MLRVYCVLNLETKVASHSEPLWE